MTWTAQQSAALQAVAKWLSDKRSPQVFRLFGFAGTGKTTIAKEMQDMVKGTVLYACFTGKASLVLRRKECHGASTLHSLIYTVERDKQTGEINFVLNSHDSRLCDAALLVVDECSMVGDELAADVLSFGKKVLVLGDPAQLPPIKGTGVFTECKPDFMLTEIHRQAEDNPIIRMSMDVRESRALAHGQYGDSRVVRLEDLSKEEIYGADMRLVGLNDTRHRWNRKNRIHLGINQVMPTVGERLICLRNNRENALINGSLWDAISVESEPDTISLKIKSDEDADFVVETNALPAIFKGEDVSKMDWKKLRGYDQFDFGYTITTHKSQGSQWPHVLIKNESGAFREHANRWLYTAITRASDRVTVIQ